MLIPFLILIAGLVILVWSADRFVEGASAVASQLGMSPLLIGMVIVGFGTSAPELVVSIMAALDGSSAIAIGNAFGSNITNIGLVLGVTAMISPIVVESSILRKQLPLLLIATLMNLWLMSNGDVARWQSAIMLSGFFIFFGWSIYSGLRKPEDALNEELEKELEELSVMSPLMAWISTIGGIVLLVVSSRMMVYGAVKIATSLGVSEIVIGLTVVAIGTSLPELASSLAAVKKNQHDMALGNIIGSNIFNNFGVVGFAGVISPFTFPAQEAKDILFRDVGTMIVLTVLLFVFGYSFTREHGRINRFEGAFLAACYFGYSIYLVTTAVPIF